MINIIAQIIGFAGAVTYFIVFQQKKRKNILSLSVVACLLFIIHFVMLKAYTGAVMNSLGAVRCVIYYYNDRKWGKSKLWLAFFVAASSVLCILTWKDVFSVLPLTAMVLTSISFWMKKERNIRLLTLPTSPCWMIYNFHSGSVAGVITEIIVTSSLIISIIKYDILKKDKNKKVGPAVEAGADIQHY